MSTTLLVMVLQHNKQKSISRAVCVLSGYCCIAGQDWHSHFSVSTRRDIMTVTALEVTKMRSAIKTRISSKLYRKAEIWCAFLDATPLVGKN